MKTKHQHGIVIAFSGMLAAVLGVTMYQQVPGTLNGDMLGSMNALMMSSSFMLQPQPIALDPMQPSSMDGKTDQPGVIDMMQSSIGDDGTLIVQEQDETLDPNEVVAIVENEDGTTTEYTRSQLENMETAFSSSSDTELMEPDDMNSSFVSAITCKNVELVEKIKKVTGKTQPQEYRKSYPNPTPPPKTRTTVKKIASRCDKATAEASAKADAISAFRNACGLPDSCANEKECADLGVTYKYGELKVVFTTKENKKSDPVMNCAGETSYTSVATITDQTCTSVRRCESLKPQRY